MFEDGPSDKFLIDRYISGDDSSLAILVKKWHKVFCQKAYWVLRDKDLAKDVVQESWIIIIKKLHSLKKTESFKSWALRIIYTKSIDAHKRRTKESQKINTIGREDYSKANEDNSELKKKLLQEIKNLSNDKQDIIRLFYVEEYTIKEISSFLKIPLGTVKSRLFKARERLKKLLK